MLESIVTVAVEIFKCLLGPIGRQSGYLQNYSSNMENLKEGVEELKDARKSMQKKVDAAWKNGDEIEETVKKWLINVDKKIDGAEKLIQDEEEANKKCFMGLCPNLKKRYQLSKKAVTVEKAVVGFKQEAEKFERISYRTVPAKAWLPSVQGYEAFDSRMSTLKKIQNALSDPNISMVGVYGTGGVGKTTLVKEVARQGKKDGLFEEVVFTELSQAADPEKIQKEIAEKLGLEFFEDSVSVRADRLRVRLKNEKILVVLDNMWEELPLETVGIPYGDDDKGCKVLLTARDRKVLSRMGSKDNFPIDVLNKEEAWRLFKKKAGDDVENRTLKSTAVDVVKTCGGLPIFIITIAGALRGRSLPQWKIALRELQTPSSENFEGVAAKAYKIIALSYNYLKNEQLQKTFLLCSIMENHAFTRDLFKYGMGLGIFQGVHTMEQDRDTLYAFIDDLKDSSLLLEGDSSEYFSMHDVVRDVARSIACALVVRNENVWKWPNKDTLVKCTAISLSVSSIPELPEGLECAQLEFLFIENCSIKIPENFFTRMRKLRVVDLTNMQLMSLPSSLAALTNLQTLCLDFCVLEDVAIIGKLKNLEILSFIGSDIVQLPKELGQLTKLRLLDLEGCSNLNVIAPHVISSLTRLEELYMSDCSVEWGVEGPNSESSNATLDELMHLPRLSALEIDIRNENILPEGLLSKRLSRYRISIGGMFLGGRRNVSWYKHESSRMLKLKLNSMGICLENLQVVKDAENLWLDTLQGVENVLFKLDTDGLTQLKYLHVQNNPEILCIVDSMERISSEAFPLLELLFLDHLINLKKICQDELKAESFNELNTIEVGNCDKLRNIFSFSTSKCLPRLQKLAIFNCDNVEEIFAIGGENNVNNNQVLDKIEFAQLTTLILGRLPQLTCFCKVVKAQDNLITSTSTQLFSEEVVLPNLEALELDEINVDKIWHNEFPAMSSSCFRSLTRLIVRNCHKLRYIFSSSMEKSFEQLQHLEIHDCTAVEEIIKREEGAEAAASFVFPRVTTLILSKLPELRCFCPEMHISEWPVLEKLEVYSCDKVKTFASELSSFNQDSQPLFLVEKVFPNLEELKVKAKEIAIIWQNEFPEHLLGKLKFLEVENDESPGFPLVLLERFHNLEKLTLVRSSYKEIFSNGPVEIHVGKLAKIKNLTLSKLNELNHLWEQNSKTDSIFQSLEVLQVSFCQNLANLWLPSASFRHLTELVVWECDKLMNLVTSTTAKTLLHLVNMSVSSCSGITEVVVVDEATEGDAAEDSIIFSKLKYLALFNLESLTSFCSGNCSFNFPCLEFLELSHCPKMKIFSVGEVNTPRVKVWYGTEGKSCWANDLNRTIQQLHQQKLLEGREVN